MYNGQKQASQKIKKGHLYKNLPPSHPSLNGTKTIQQPLMVFHIMHLPITSVSLYEQRNLQKRAQDTVTVFMFYVEEPSLL